MNIGSLVPAGSRAWASGFAGLAAAFPEHAFLLGEEATGRDAASLDALVTTRLPQDFLGKARGLRALFVPLAGVDHLPIGLLASRGVRVFNVHANGAAVAERALALILAFHGRLVAYHEDLRRLEWHGFWAGKGSEEDWDSIAGKRCAILGTGAIGSALATLLKALGCEVVGWRRLSSAILPQGFDRMASSLEAAIQGASIVVSTLPLTPETRGLLSGPTLALMKGSFLVNVGRASVIDEEALYLALRDGVLAGAGLDVWYQYPPPGSTRGAPSAFPIHELPNVLLSPHVGGSARQATKAAISQTCANLSGWIATGHSENEVDMSRLY